MRKAFLVSSALLLAAFVLQFIFAAVGGFTKPAGDGAYALHSVNGMAVIPALTLLTALSAALARAPGRLVALAILPIGLVVVQALIAMLANSFTDATGASTPLGLTVGGLHALNGIIAVHVVVGVLRGAKRVASDTPVAVREGAPA
ncbi:DUF6220 domain-containing protein [Micromonospora tarensis]|uniref:Cytochrome b561 n=1 Tax=Micromonospora tarensis TaxID=2806100 RepID=A0ABS1YGZ0_9ACTN|nr:DUF6220 domain-containing protein [Micromonospora tarensis]MBM0276690.1 hypothetical protein [Micromonospora tarensis]